MNSPGLLRMLLLCAISVQPAPAQPPAAATPPPSIAGCVRDRAGAVLPGVTVVAKTRGHERTTTTDATGCYAFKDLAAASYRITGRLPGFDNVTRDHVVFTTGVTARFDFTMSVSAVCECVRVAAPPRTLAEAWQQTDAALHVRIGDPPPGSPVQSGSYKHVVTVLQAMKRAAGEPASATAVVIESQGNGAAGPFDPGQELVILPKWDPGTRVFYRVGVDCCGTPGIVFVLDGGRVARAPAELASYVGMPVDALLDELRALAVPR